MSTIKPIQSQGDLAQLMGVNSSKMKLSPGLVLPPKNFNPLPPRKSMTNNRYASAVSPINKALASKMA